MQHAREQLAHTALVNAEAASHSPMSSGAVQCSHWNFYCQQMYILQPLSCKSKIASAELASQERPAFVP